MIVLLLACSLLPERWDQEGSNPSLKNKTHINSFRNFSKYINLFKINEKNDPTATFFLNCDDSEEQLESTLRLIAGNI